MRRISKGKRINSGISSPRALRAEVESDHCDGNNLLISNVLVCVQRSTRLQYLYISSDMPPPHYDFLIKVCPIYYTKFLAADRRDIPALQLLLIGDSGM